MARFSISSRQVQQVQVVGLTKKVADSVEEVAKLIQRHKVVCTTGQTSGNSSRSHAGSQIVLLPSGSTELRGKFSFIGILKGIFYASY